MENRLQWDKAVLGGWLGGFAMTQMRGDGLEPGGGHKDRVKCSDYGHVLKVHLMGFVDKSSVSSVCDRKDLRMRPSI